MDANGNYERTFKANGVEYFILSPEDGIGVFRYGKLSQLSTGVHFTGGLGDQVNNWARVVGMLNEFSRGQNNLDEIFALCRSQAEGIKEASKEVFDISLWLCSLFVVRKDEDLSKWITAEQEQKINDWNTEGIHELDFFALARLGVNAFLQM